MDESGPDNLILCESEASPLQTLLQCSGPNTAIGHGAPGGREHHYHLSVDLSGGLRALSNPPNHPPPISLISYLSARSESLYGGPRSGRWLPTRLIPPPATAPAIACKDTAMRASVLLRCFSKRSNETAGYISVWISGSSFEGEKKKRKTEEVGEESNAV